MTPDLCHGIRSVRLFPAPRFCAPCWNIISYPHLPTSPMWPPCGISNCFLASFAFPLLVKPQIKAQSLVPRHATTGSHPQCQPTYVRRRRGGLRKHRRVTCKTWRDNGKQLTTTLTTTAGQLELEYTALLVWAIKRTRKVVPFPLYFGNECCDFSYGSVSH